MFHKCKVTVIDKKLDKKIAEKFLSNPDYMRICDRVEIGQEFIIEDPFEIPTGLCASAWADIRSAIITAATGGSYKFMRHENLGVAICSDPFRPVTFQIERLS